MKKILVVEDDDVSRDVILYYLKKNYEYEYAIDGDEAIKKASENEYSLILMDINLKQDISGTAAMHKIKEIKYYKNIPIVAVTAYAMNGDREKFLDEGFDDYISKPFTMKEFLSLISRILKL